MKGTRMGFEVAAGPGLSRRRILTAGAVAATGMALALEGGGRQARAASKAPAIFYSPHQDDEAIGLAGSILEHKAAGRPVYLVLVSRGENDKLAEIMNMGDCKWLGEKCSAPKHYHKLGWAEKKSQEVVAARKAEFRASAKALGVDKVIDFDLPDDAFGDYDGFVKKIVKKVRELDKKYPGASHKFSAGWLDLTATHKACSDAAAQLFNDREITDVRFHHIYAYQQRAEADRAKGASYVLNIPPKHMEIKRKAILAYNTWDPSRNLYSLGYHSVSEWLENAYADPREFVYTLPDDYVFGRIPGH
ncbi:PIG-L deacetylase family protein [Streptomyces huiliensis]|uniref:PIG-L deacetylase family protein n=1 Tax=Streptomyces huiliensis TaxID=2876027 RepID=UPI001CBEA780|nr:PIG-L family deacetylase [Streptomyces huiliensis]MBZ4320751.1 PIG-L family deacetylase [Streptomyces huiliensis]